MMTQIRYADAARYYAEAVGLTPEKHAEQLSERLTDLGEAAWRAGDYPPALDAARRALALDEVRLPADDARLVHGSTTWPCSTRTPAATPRPSRSISAPRDQREGARPRAPRPRHPAQQPGQLYRATGRYAEAEPLYRARPRHRREGARPRAPRRRQSPQQPGRALPGHRPLRRGRAALCSAPSRSTRRRSAPSTPTVATNLNNLAGSTRPPAAMAAGRAALRARPRHRREGARPGAPRPSPPASTTWPALPGHRPLRPQAEPLYQRALAICEKSARPRAPRPRRRPQQPGHALPGHRPLRRGRAALRARPCHRREERSAPSTRSSLSRSTISPRSTGPPAATAERLFLCTLPRWKGSRAEDLAWPSTSTTSAELHRATGRYGEAEPLFARALAILEKSLPPNHPHQVQFRESYAALLDQLGRTDEASELRVQAEVIRQQREQPPPSP